MCVDMVCSCNFYVIVIVMLNIIINISCRNRSCCHQPKVIIGIGCYGKLFICCCGGVVKVNSLEVVKIYCCCC